MTPLPPPSRGWASPRPRAAWPVVLLAHAALLAGWQLALQRPLRPAPAEAERALVWVLPSLPLARTAPAHPPPRQRGMALLPSMAEPPPRQFPPQSTPHAGPPPRPDRPEAPAATPISEPITAAINAPAPLSPVSPHPPAAPESPAALNLALPAAAARAASQPPAAWASTDPRRPQAPGLAERMAATLGTDTRLRSTALNDGARRWQSGRHCVETRPARDSQLHPFDGTSQRLPQLAQGC